MTRNDRVTVVIFVILSNKWGFSGHTGHSHLFNGNDISIFLGKMTKILSIPGVIILTCSI